MKKYTHKFAVAFIFILSGQWCFSQSCVYTNFIWEQSSNDACELSFTNHSSGASLSYQWTFGDGAFSTEENPQHIYSTFGCFTVQLTATDNNGGSSLATHQVCIQRYGTNLYG